MRALCQPGAVVALLPLFVRRPACNRMFEKAVQILGDVICQTQISKKLYLCLFCAESVKPHSASARILTRYISTSASFTTGIDAATSSHSPRDTRQLKNSHALIAGCQNLVAISHNVKHVCFTKVSIFYFQAQNANQRAALAYPRLPQSHLHTASDKHRSQLYSHALADQKSCRQPAIRQAASSFLLPLLSGRHIFSLQLILVGLSHLLRRGTRSNAYHPPTILKSLLLLPTIACQPQKFCPHSVLRYFHSLSRIQFIIHLYQRLHSYTWCVANLPRLCSHQIDHGCKNGHLQDKKQA